MNIPIRKVEKDGPIGRKNGLRLVGAHYMAIWIDLSTH